jgi:hypothetical protein
MLLSLPSLPMLKSLLTSESSIVSVVHMDPAGPCNRIDCVDPLDPYSHIKCMDPVYPYNYIDCVDELDQSPGTEAQKLKTTTCERNNVSEVGSGD